MKLTPIATRIKALVTDFSSVKAMASMPKPATLLNRAPAAVVVPTGERGGGNTVATGIVQQQNTFRFGVMHSFKDASDQKGGKSADGLAEIRDALKTALVGWKHPDADGACLFDSGAVVSVDGAGLIWLDQFTIPVIFRNT